MWWGRHDSEHPVALDCLHVSRSVPDRAALATEVLAAGLAALVGARTTVPPPYELTVPADWRERADAAAAVAWRREAARRVGMTEQVERLRVEWRTGGPVPAAPTRLAFRPEPDDDVVLDALRQVAVGSLDVATVRGLAALGADAQARDDLEFYRSCPGERGWWRLGYGLDGTLAALAIPSATPYGRNAGYLGVVPPARGLGLVDEVLGEITRIHAGAGAERITATTDATNAPMAAAFERAGYRRTATRLVLEAPPVG